MRTRLAFLHRWSATLEEFDFTVHLQPGKDETHVNGLRWLPVEQAPPEGGEATLVIQPLADGKASRLAVRELHNATHVGAKPLWKLFRYRFSFTWGKRICSEVAKSCIHPQASTDYGVQGKTSATIVSDGPWNAVHRQSGSSSGRLEDGIHHQLCGLLLK